MVTVSIIGTAGRDKTKVYTSELFDKMVYSAKYILRDLKDITLVSGGAAWADHVAVKLYLDNFCQNLILHFPCKWDNDKFIDNGNWSWKINPGKTANNYHHKFSQIMGNESLKDISNAINKGAIIIDDYNGFHSRNAEVAKSDYLIAFTWSSNGYPCDGGTLDTWKKSNSQKCHVDLNTLINIY